MARQPNLRENRERKPVDAGVGTPFYSKYWSYFLLQGRHMGNYALSRGVFCPVYPCKPDQGFE